MSEVNKALLWVRQSLAVLVVLLLAMWLAMQWGAQMNPEEIANGIWLDAEGAAEVQTGWLCYVAAGPGCVIVKDSLTLPSASADQRLTASIPNLK
jgi:hypothetical protein